MSEPTRIVATDCGSTTTKAILIEKRDGHWSLICRGEAPTTVEAPYDDVTAGVTNAIREVEELAGLEILDPTGVGLIHPSEGNRGVDLYLSTSSAGGGLQMTVAGVVKAMSAESAERAALGAGAIIMDVIAVDDGRKDWQKIERIRNLRPDMVLVSGGTDGGTVSHLVDIGEMLVAADPKPRLGGDMKLPVIFAGNTQAREAVSKLLDQRVDLRITDNLRPELDRENLLPAREAIHELFLQHVMQQAPGYGKLSTWADSGIMSTPNAVGKMVETYARHNNLRVLAVDIGGATTDVFSVFAGIFNRTVSANLGMSYSICNVLAEAGIQNIIRWLPFEIDEWEVRNRLRNKMIRPTTIPETLQDLRVEQALAREALRLAFDHHKMLARGLKGVQQKRTMGDMLNQSSTGDTLVEMMRCDLIIGSGGVLSHAPRRGEAALMMLDAYQPEGVTYLAVDSIFMMPQLGVLSTIQPEASSEVFDRDCLVRLGPVIAPVGQVKPGGLLCEVRWGSTSVELRAGDIKVFPLASGEQAEVTIVSAKNVNVGEGKGRARTVVVEGGVVGLILDGRGRPISHGSTVQERTALMHRSHDAFGLPVA
ncbi:MAG: glutamate mutase L [Armatimonadota bacterium]